MAKRSKAKAKRPPEAPPKRRKRRNRVRSVTTSRVVRETYRNPRHNPPLLTDLAEFALPGFGGFTATKFVANLASSQIAKRFPAQAKHAGAISSVGAFLAAWYLGHKVKFLARWHTPIVVGSAIATLQNLVQIYAPGKLSWLLGDPKQAAAATVMQTQAVQQQIAAQQAQQDELPDHLEEVTDDPRFYTFNDAYDAGRYKGSRTAAPYPQQTAQIPSEQTPVDAEDEDLASGIFAGSALEN